jgi:muconate cycloisomerase
MRIPYTTALAEKKTTEAELVTVETDEGLRGLGQAAASAPRYAPFDEFPAEVALTVRERLAPAVLGEDPRDLATIHRKMETAARGHVYAHTTIDLALHDILGQAQGVPVYRLLGGRVRDRIPLVAPHLGYMAPAELARVATEYVAQGYRHINLRAGFGLETDKRMLGAVRDAVGDGVGLDIDFSQSLALHLGRPDLVVAYVRALEAFGLDSVEQPLAAGDLDGMARLAEAIDTPLIADESVFSLDDLQRVIERRAAGIVKIKIVKTGGIWPARKWVALGEAAGLSFTVGHGIAAGVQNAAEAHLAFTIAHLKIPGEMNGYLRVQDDVTAVDLRCDGTDLLPPQAPGLGATLDPEKLRRYALR